MNDPQSKKVTLPDGNVVEVSNDELSWWTTPFASGFASPRQLAPDPNQPRKAMNPAKLAELEESVRTTGVRNPIIVSPRSLASWVQVAPEDEGAFFVIVSGHRRRGCALKLELEAVPITVRIYPSAKEFYLDASVLNIGHEDLTPLEEGYEIARLKRLGATVKETCENFGMNATQYYQRLNLTYLHPDIQKLLDPELTEHKRLPVVTAAQLGGVETPKVAELDLLLEKLGADAQPEHGVVQTLYEELDEDGLRFELQHILLRVILKRGYPAVRAVKFIREQTQELDSFREARAHSPGRKPSRDRPEKRREILTNLAKLVGQSVIVDWSKEDYRRAFSNAPKEELEALFRDYVFARESLDTVVELLDSAIRARQQAAA